MSTIAPVTSVRSCDFEDTKICGYTQAKTDNFDWTRANGVTTSQGTGPTNDHTYGTAQGKWFGPFGQGNNLE